LIHLDKKDTVSFASSAKFKPDYDLGFDISNISSLRQLEEQIEEELPNKNMIYAIKVTGYFDKLHARSEDIDTVPYTPIVSWMQTHQHEFDCNDQKSTLVMFRIPDSLSSLGVKYHAHFVNDSRTMGGHVFDVAAADDLDVEITPLTEAVVSLRKNIVPTVSVNGDFQADKFYSVIERSSSSATIDNNSTSTNSANK
jgi:acetolactate decarboxylase